MTPRHTFPSDGDVAGPMAGPARTVVQAVSHSPAGKVWATPAGLSCPLDCGQYVHTVAEQTLSPPVGTWCQRSSGSCFEPEPVGVSQAPSGRQAPWVSPLGSVLPRVRSQRQGDPLVWWLGTPWGATAAVLASPRGALFCHHHGWHRPARLGDAASHQPATVSHLSLPLRGTLVVHSRGDFKGHKKHPSPLLSPLHWGFQMGLTTLRQHHAPIHSSSPQSITVMHKSPGTSQTKPAITRLQQEHSVALPVPMGGGIPPPWWPWHFSGEQEGCTASELFSCTPQLYSVTLGE